MVMASINNENVAFSIFEIFSDKRREKIGRIKL